MSAQSSSPSRGLTAVQGLKVGHHTLTTRPTGCTVILAENGATAGVDVRGSAPGTRETDLLNPTTVVDRVHAIVLSGGSAFGLDAASGVVRSLEERGDVIDPSTGKVIAGMRTEDGKGLADVRVLLRQGTLDSPAPEALQHKTIGVVATNATLTKTQATKMAQMAQAGLARAIVPVHTSVDGDAVFALATGTRAGAADPDTIGALAADAMAQAIVRAVRAATGIPGFPAARDLR